MNINHICNITGCAAALAVGVWGQNAKADYPNANVIGLHWQVAPNVFRSTFDDCFQRSDFYWLWSTTFPAGFKNAKGSLYRIRTGSGSVTFHTDDDLKELKIDGSLKKILKILGSSEFLKKVLPEAVTQSILTCAVGGEDFRTEIELMPYFDDGFFNTFGRGELLMQIKQFLNESAVLTCSFVFVFERKSSLTVLKEYRASYNVSDGESVRAEFFKKKGKLPCFPWSAAAEAKERIPLVYAKLRDDFIKDNCGKYRDCKVCKATESAKRALEDSFPSPVLQCIRDIYGDSRKMPEGFAALYEAYKSSKHSESEIAQLYKKYEVHSLLRILITEDFLKGIFGEKFWNILEYGASDGSSGNLDMSFAISPCNDGLKVSCLFRNQCRGSMTADVVAFQGESLKWEWLDFNYIKFCFFFDPKKNAISHVTFGDKLILNYEIVGKGETEDVFLTTDDHCF